MLLRILRNRWGIDGGYRQVLTIALPLIMSTGAFAVHNFLDRMFLAWYSPDALAAAFPAGTAYVSLYVVFRGMVTYSNTFVAQYYGAGRYDQIGPVVWQGIYLSILGGLFFLALRPLSGFIFALAGHDLSVQHSEVVYFRTVCLGAGPQLGSMALAAFFNGRGRTWAVMCVFALSVPLNTILDYLLIFGHGGFPEMGIRGAATATVVAWSFCFLALLSLVLRRRHNDVYRTISGWRPEKDLLRRLVRFGLPSGVNDFIELGSITLFVLLLGRISTTSLAAASLVLAINTLAFLPMVGVAISIAVLVGRYLGARRPDLAQTSVLSGFHMILLYMASCAGAYVLFPNALLVPFAVGAASHSFHDIHRLSVVFLRFLAAYCVFDAASLTFSSALRGAGDTKFVMLGMLASSVTMLVLPTYLLIVILDSEPTAPWYALVAFTIALATLFGWRFVGGRWKGMRVIEP